MSNVLERLVNLSFEFGMLPENNVRSFQAVVVVCTDFQRACMLELRLYSQIIWTSQILVFKVGIFTNIGTVPHKQVFVDNKKKSAQYVCKFFERSVHVTQAQ